MTHSSEDSEDQKKTSPPAPYAFQDFMKTWRQDFGRNIFNQMSANAVQELIGTWKQDLGKSMVSHMMPANVVQGLIGTWKQDLGKSVVSRLVPTNAFEEFRKSWGLSSMISQSLMEGMLSTKSISSLFDPQQFNWASTLSTEQTSVVRRFAE